MRLKQENLARPLYSTETSDQIYREMLDQARAVLSAGYSVVADATFLSREYRSWFRELAEELGVEFQILACNADFDELSSRIRNRTNDPSEATVGVLQKQIDQHDPLDEQEQFFASRST